MNKTIFIRLGIFLLGAGAGFLVGKKMYEEYYANIAQEEIDNVKEYYAAKYDDSKWIQHTIDKAIVEGDANPKKEVVGVNPDSFRANQSPLTRSSLDTNPNEVAKRNYHLAGVKVASSDDIDDSEEDDGPDTDAAGMTEKEINPEIDRTAPYIIDDVEFSESFDHHDKVSLYYYRVDGVLTEEDETIIGNIAGTIGSDAKDALEEASPIWVRNEPLGIDYEIVALNKSNAEATGIIGGKAAMSPREQYEKRRVNINGEIE
jgi:hypothetical protein